MKNPFSFFFRSRDKPQGAVSAAPTFYFGTSASGKSVNPRNAVQVSTVYACVRVIAETIASLPLGVYEEESGGSRKATEHQLYRRDYAGHTDTLLETRHFSVRRPL